MPLTKEARLKGMATQLRNMGLEDIADQITGASESSPGGAAGGSSRSSAASALFAQKEDAF